MTNEPLIALEAVREEMTMAELAKKYGVHLLPAGVFPNHQEAMQIGTWKRATIRLPGRVCEACPRRDKQFLDTPWYGSRQMGRYMQRQGHKCGRH